LGRPPANIPHQLPEFLAWHACPEPYPEKGNSTSGYIRLQARAAPITLASSVRRGACATP
jgi:hypothetical protein